MQSTDVVVVDMRRGRDYGTLNKVDDCSAQRGNTRTGIDDQIAIGSLVPQPPDYGVGGQQPK